MNARLSKISKILNDELPRLRSDYKLETLGIFGSYIRDEQNSDSDVDILVTFSESPTLIQFIRLKNHLSDLLGVQVDLVMKKALKPRIGQQVLKELVPLL